MSDAEIIKAVRSEMGWSVERLASVTGLSVPSVRSWEAGRRVPGPDVVKSLLVAVLERRGKDQARADHLLRLAGR